MHISIWINKKQHPFAKNASFMVANNCAAHYYAAHIIRTACFKNDAGPFINFKRTQVLLNVRLFQKRHGLHARGYIAYFPYLQLCIMGDR